MTANAPRNVIFNGDCIDVMQAFDAGSIDFVLTDPPYVTNYRDRQGRSVANDDNGRWLKPAFAEMRRVLQDGGFAVSFYDWNKVDLFVEAWRAADFRIVGHLVFRKAYASSSRFLRYAAALGLASAMLLAGYLLGVGVSTRAAAEQAAGNFFDSATPPVWIILFLNVASFLGAVTAAFFCGDQDHAANVTEGRRHPSRRHPRGHRRRGLERGRGIVEREGGKSQLGQSGDPCGGEAPPRMDQRVARARRRSSCLARQLA